MRTLRIVSVDPRAGHCLVGLRRSRHSHRRPGGSSAAAAQLLLQQRLAAIGAPTSRSCSSPADQRAASLP